MRLTNPSRRALARGFTLIELLVTLVVTAVGLLGLGKLQATALAESQVSRTRALMTFQAESLAGAMRANPYWTSNPGGAIVLPGFKVTAGNATPDLGGSTLTPISDPNRCTVKTKTSPLNCAQDVLASVDVANWTANFVRQFPSATATVACNQLNGPTSCDITLSWNEHYVAMNRSTSGGRATATASDTSQLGNTLVLHVQP